jgi:hypothetical protein
MSDKMIRIKVSELRKLVREAMNAPVASRQGMIQAADSEDDTDNSQAGKSKEQLNDSDDLKEFHSFENDFAQRLSDKKYEGMAKQIFDAWASRDTDVDWAGVVNLFARNHSKNLGQEVDKTKLYEKVLDLVERHADQE